MSENNINDDIKDGIIVTEPPAGLAKCLQAEGFKTTSGNHLLLDPSNLEKEQLDQLRSIFTTFGCSSSRLRRS